MKTTCLFYTFTSPFTRVFLLAACVLLASTSGTLANVGIEFTSPGSVGTPPNAGTAAYKFTANSAIVVTHLGTWDNNGDGLSVSHAVGLWDSSGTLLASTTVPSGALGLLEKSFRYESITPLVLTAGQTYYVGSLLGGTDAYCFSPAGFTADPNIAFQGAAVAPNTTGASLTFPTVYSPGTNGVFGGNIKFAVPFQNGSFESNGGQGTTSATAWEFANGGLVDNTEGTSEGAWAITFNAASTSNGGRVAQTFATVPGQAYSVRFDFGAFAAGGSTSALKLEVRNGSGPTTGAQLITPGSLRFGTFSYSATPTVTDQTGTAQAYGPTSAVNVAVGTPNAEFNTGNFTFTAQAAASTLVFTDQSTGGADGQDAILDNVRVVECLVQSSFESPVTGDYVGGLQVTAAQPWTFTGGGVAKNGSFGLAGPNLLGQYAFLQSGNSISQTVNFPVTGYYQLSYLVGSRVGYGSPNYTISVDGTSIFTEDMGGGAAFYHWNRLTRVTAGSHTLTFANTSAAAAGDVTAYFDNISLFLNNAAPTISAIADQTITANSATGALGFTINDAELAEDSLVVSATSNNTTLVPAGNYAFGGSGANRTVTVTPAAGQAGTATITVRVSDGLNSSPETFVLTVNATVPSAPVIGSASAGDGFANVTFSAPSNDGGSAITSYTVTSSPGGLASTSNGSPIAVFGLTNGTAYTFTVRANNGAGQGPASAPSNQVTPIGVPGAPTGVTATGGSSSASISFSAPFSNGSAITNYIATSSPGGLTGSSSSSPVTVGGLQNGTSYTFTVRASNGVGQGPASAPSNSITTNTAPIITSNGGGATASISIPENTTAVTTVTATDAEVPATQSLSYSKSGADAGLFTLTTGGVLTFTSAPDFEGAHGNTYSVTVTVTDNGTSPLSDSQNLTITVTNVNDAPAIAAVGNGSPLATVLSRLDAAATGIAALVPGMYPFTDGVTGTSINDGGNDMYDGGNFLNTSLATSIPYSDGVITTHAGVGAGGSYFTRKSTGLFTFVADLHGATSFGTSGNLGADGQGSTSSSVLTRTSGGVTYKGFLKRVYGAGDPSINELFIVEDRAGLAQTAASDTNDGQHDLTGLGGSTRLYYLLFASAIGGFVSDAQYSAIMDYFLANVAGGSSGITRIAGATGPAVNIATVSDAETSAGSLTVTATTVPAGIHVTGIANTAGSISAAVTAEAGTAPGAYSVILTVSDGALSSTGGLTVNVIPVDYTVTTSGSAIVVTDVTGNSDTLAISDPGSGSIKFAAASRAFLIDNTTGIVGDSGSISGSGITSITVNTAAGNDIINVGTITSTLPGLTLDGGTGTDTVNMNGDIAFASNANLTITAETVTTAAAADLVLSGTGLLSITADDIALNATSTLVAATSVTLKPQTAARLIYLGAEVGGTLSLTDAELDSITAGTLIIGNSSSGNIVVQASVSPAGTNALNLVSGGTIGDTNTTGADITVANLTTNGNLVSAGSTPGVFSVAGSQTFATDSYFSITLGGTTPGTQHGQLSATGSVTIGTNVTLALGASGGFVPSPAQNFTIINRTGGTGTFAGLPEGATISSNFLGTGKPARISYVGGTGDDVVITTANPDIQVEQPTGTILVDGTASIDFGNVAVLAHSTAKVFKVSNTGTSDLTLGAVSATGATGEFSVNTSGMSVGTVLAPGGFTTFSVTFNPLHGGLLTAAIHIASDDPDETPFDITLTGTGTAATFTPGKDPPPGVAGGTWASVRSGMVLASSGALAFRAHLDTVGGVTVNDFQGIWKSPDGTVASTALVVRTGTTLEPATGNALFDVLPLNPIINNAGQTSFIGMLRVNSGSPVVTTSSDTGAWSELGTGGLKKLMREGDTLAGSTVGTVAPSTWIAGGSTAAAFTIKLGTGSALVRVDVAGTTVTPSIIAKQGDAAPVQTGGDAGTFDALVGNTSDPRIDAAGNVAFLSTVLPAGQGIWYRTVAGALTAVANTNQNAPGLGGPLFAGFERPSLSADGSTIAFRAFLTGANGQAVFKGTPAAPVAIAKTNDTAITGIPAGSKLWSVWSPFTNNTGRVAFRVSLLDVSSAETRAIVSDAGGTLSVIARAGQAAPGLGTETFTNFDHPVIGDGNQCAFIAAASGGSVGLYRQAAGGGALSLVMAVGDLVNFPGGGSDTISQITIPGSSTEDRKCETKTIDAAGHLLVHVTYASGRTGSLLTVP